MFDTLRIFLKELFERVNIIKTMREKLAKLACKSKKEDKDQESIQSSTTSDPEYQWESDNFTIRHHKREPRGQPFPSM